MSMKKLKTIVLVEALSFFALLNVAADATFENDALIDLKKESAAMKKDALKPRIVTVAEEFEDEGKTSISLSKSIRESVSPNRSHYVFETRTVKGIERTEYKYVRQYFD